MRPGHGKASHQAPMVYQFDTTRQRSFPDGTRFLKRETREVIPITRIQVYSVPPSHSRLARPCR